MRPLETLPTPQEETEIDSPIGEIIEFLIPEHGGNVEVQREGNRYTFRTSYDTPSMIGKAVDALVERGYQNSIGQVTERHLKFVHVFNDASDQRLIQEAIDRPHIKERIGPVDRAPSDIPEQFKRTV